MTHPLVTAAYGCACLVTVATGLAMAAEDRHFVFHDVTEQAGLWPDLERIKGHAAAWGDVTGNGWPDLYVGTYHQGESKRDMLLLNREGTFAIDQQEHLRISSFTSGAVFADLDNSGRLDLFISNQGRGEDRVEIAHNLLYRNDGDGQLTDVTPDSGLDAPGFLGRSVAAVDFDGDGLLDLFMAEEYYHLPTQKGTPLYRNLGEMRFENVTEAAGLPVGVTAGGVAVADVNNNTWPDLFIVGSSGDNRLYLNDGQGGFSEAPGTREVFAWDAPSTSDYPAGVAFGDVNRNGRTDIVIGQHYSRPWVEPVPIRLYLNRGINDDGTVIYEDVTDRVGLEGLPMKAPHVEIQDFDNDGWPDIYASMVKFDDQGRPHPLIYRNMGVDDNGLPRFEEDVLDLTDFPTDEDRAGGPAGPFFERMLDQRKVIYMAAGPTVDFDRNGRLDIFLANWWAESPSMLLRNDTPGGHWLQVRVEGGDGLNRMGIGTRIEVYPAGKLGEADALLGNREIAVGFGYCSGQEAIAHFGLAGHDKVDLRVVFPHGLEPRSMAGVRANQRLVIEY